ncbi:MAG: hypothetical protein V4714_08375 [Bacteroidota bacterium]
MSHTIHLFLEGMRGIFQNWNDQGSHIIIDKEVLSQPIPSVKDDILNMRSDWASLKKDTKKAAEKLEVETHV